MGEAPPCAAPGLEALGGVLARAPAKEAATKGGGGTMWGEVRVPRPGGVGVEGQELCIRLPSRHGRNSRTTTSKINHPFPSWR